MRSLRNDQGFFIHIDGIDGAGKSTLLSTVRSWADQKELRVFDVVEWSKREKRLPNLQEIGDADLLLTAEPTHAGIGAVIRDEIIQNNAPYNARFSAQAFALDRGVQYQRLILPFLREKPGRWVVQDRGLLSSLAYQPLQSQQESSSDQTITIDWLLELEGNRIAVNAPPDAFVFIDIDARIAQERLAGRTTKIDNHRFDAFEFQHALAARYRDPDVTNPLVTRGTEVVIVDGTKTKQEMSNAMLAMLKTISE